MMQDIFFTTIKMIFINLKKLLVLSKINLAIEKNIKQFKSFI